MRCPGHIRAIAARVLLRLKLALAPEPHPFWFAAAREMSQPV